MTDSEREIVRRWAETELRSALKDEDRLMFAASLIKFALDEGKSALDALGAAIGSFVLDAVDPKILDPRGHERN